MRIKKSDLPTAREIKLREIILGLLQHQDDVVKIQTEGRRQNVSGSPWDEARAAVTVDLRTCKAGDKLISRHGKVLTYVSPLPEDNFYDHLVRYPDGSNGTRCHDGFAYRNPSKRLPEDHDIVRIVHV
jgi:hypothetical protein